MPRIQRRLLVFALCALAACTLSPNVKDGQIRCKGPTEYPSGYTCVTGDQTSTAGVCCKDKGCWNKLFSGDAGAEAPITRLDGATDLPFDSASPDGAPDVPRDSMPDIPFAADAAQD